MNFENYSRRYRLLIDRLMYNRKSLLPDFRSDAPALVRFEHEILKKKSPGLLRNVMTILRITECLFENI